MSEPADERLTGLLDALARREPHAEAELMPVVYEELRRLARSVFREIPGHTLQPTALVHEAYVRLVRHEGSWSGREHFLAVAARAMRQILANHAERRRTLKRGGDRARVTLAVAESDGAAAKSEIDLLALNDALDQLRQLDVRQSDVVELRYLGGLSVSEVARLLEVSERTVERDWRMARAWLQTQLAGT